MSGIDAMEFWMTHLSNRSESVRKGYPLYLMRFAEWVGKTPNELIEMKKEALEHGGDRRENLFLEGKVKQFISYLENEATTARGDKGYGIGTVKLAYAGIRSFFLVNQYPLSLNSTDNPQGESMGSRIPEKFEVVQLVNTAKSRQYRCAILFLKDCGLRQSDVVRVKWKELKDFGDDFYGWKIVTKKRRVRALPFLGPEAAEALRALPRRSDRVFPVSAGRLCHAIKDIIGEAEKNGLEPGLTPHGLRKFTNAELQSARVSREQRYMIIGKKVGVYDENRQRKLFEVYQGAYHHLRIFGTPKTKEHDPLLSDIEVLLQIPDYRRFFREEIVEPAKAKFARLLGQEKLE